MAETAPPAWAHACVVGYDVTDFTRAARACVEARGAAAAEEISDTMSSGEDLVAQALAPLGFTFLETIGDGAMFVRDGDAPVDLDRVLIGIATSYARLTGLTIRIAHANGAVDAYALPATALRQSVVWGGNAIAALHRALDAKPRQRGGAFSLGMARADIAAKIGAAEITRGVIVFACMPALEQSGACAGRLGAALTLLDALAARADARLARAAIEADDFLIRMELSRENADARAAAVDLADAALKALGEAGIAARFGISAGEIYRGPIGRAGINAHGAPVNTAAKLAKTAAENAVRLDPELVWTRGARSAAAADSELIGRSAEIARAMAVLDAGGVGLMLEGEAGIGKSALLREIMRRRAGRADHTGLVHCPPERVLEPFGVIAAAMRAALREIEDDVGWASAALTRAGLSADWISLCRLGLRAAPTPSALVRDMPESARLPAAHACYLAVVAAIGESGGALIGIDDYQNADFYSRRLLEAHLAGGRSCAFIAARRVAEGGAASPELSSWERLAIGALSKADTLHLIDALGVADARIAQAAMTLSGGNPLAALQAARALDEGALQGVADIDAILASRLGRVTEPELVVLRILALRDAAFDAGMLKRIGEASGAPGDFLSAAQQLEARQLVRATPEGACLPVHGTISEAVSKRMPHSVRRVLSGATARALKTGGGAVSDVELARLWRDGGASGRAAIHFERAAAAAAQVGAHRSVAAYLDEALAAAPAGAATGRRALWRADRGGARWALGEIPEAAADAAASVAALVRRARKGLSERQRTALFKALSVRVETGQFLGDLDAIISGSVTASRIAQGAHDRKMAARRTYANVAYFAGLARLAPIARYAYRISTAPPVSEPDARQAAYAITSQAVLNLGFGQWGLAHERLEQARRWCAAAPEPHLEEVIETVDGLGLYYQGDWRAALARFDKLRGMAERRDHDMHRGWADYAAAEAMLAAGDAPAAWRLLDSAEHWLARIEDVQSRIIMAGLRVGALWEMNRKDEAIAQAARALELSVPPTNFGSLEGFALPALILAQAGDDDPRSGVISSNAARAQKKLNGFAMVFPIARPRADLVLAWRVARKNPAQARRLAKRAAARAQALSMGQEAPHARALQERLG